jgi:hypothetical protein
MSERKKNKKSVQDLDRKTASHMEGSYVKWTGSSPGAPRKQKQRQQLCHFPSVLPNLVVELRMPRDQSFVRTVFER